MFCISRGGKPALRSPHGAQAKCGTACRCGTAVPDFAYAHPGYDQHKGHLMPNAVEDACYALALANRIVAYEGVLDGFGHVSVRHPSNPSHYLLSRSRSPELVEPADILEFTLDSEKVTPGDILPYGEGVIHGEIFKARPDVNAVCHHHSVAILPFCVTGKTLLPVNGLGAVMGATV